MTQGIETRLYRETLVVRVPIRFQRRAALSGSLRLIVPTSKPQRDGTLIKTLARACRWERMLDGGV